MSNTKRVIEEMEDEQDVNVELASGKYKKEFEKRREALQQVLSLLDQLEKIKGIVPEKEEIWKDATDYGVENPSKSWIESGEAIGHNACRQQVALGVIKFGEWLPKIIQLLPEVQEVFALKTQEERNQTMKNVEHISKAILAELEGR